VVLFAAPCLARRSGDGVCVSCSGGSCAVRGVWTCEEVVLRGGGSSEAVREM